MSKETKIRKVDAEFLDNSMKELWECQSAIAGLVTTLKMLEFYEDENNREFLGWYFNSEAYKDKDVAQATSTLELIDTVLSERLFNMDKILSDGWLENREKRSAAWELLDKSPALIDALNKFPEKLEAFLKAV